PLTQAPPPPAGDDSAAASWQRQPADALPAISVSGSDKTAWRAVPDLIGSRPTDRSFVAETDDAGIPWLRFGDGTAGGFPRPGVAYTATYRVGGGAEGNVGAESIGHVVLDAAAFPGVAGVRNPLPATGGVEPERIERVRRDAPIAFRTQLRAV